MYIEGDICACKVTVALAGMAVPMTRRSSWDSVDQAADTTACMYIHGHICICNYIIYVHKRSYMYHTRMIYASYMYYICT